MMELKLELLTGPHYEQGFLETLSRLKPTTLSKDQFGDLLRQRIHSGIHTIVGVLAGRVVATSSVFIETKFYGNVAHIEDVATHEKFGGHGYGSAVVSQCIEIARKHNCYKVILDCAEHNIAYYKRLGFYQFENQMRMNL